ncbi:DNA adenine methylase [Curtobacterium sp. PhB42]|uniref:DNA adenine methylase n=1 Tax=unclassified Curtobacterium TaxID=257496 RepID=UPI001044B54B|nr:MULTISPECIES: DNA adenine methylase [unclassified Curtobacterium]TCU42692.1 DNA adenine methylase [Curtobacterium sp. PhB146]TDW38461.1 DNA adenine methylase [Curtobacterium sp. PhB42]TDW48468.1 DNA adenine methylase [Curtobacterium sp. PhB190]
MTEQLESHVPLEITTVKRYLRPSPLRYPGGKAALAGFFEDVIRRLKLTNATYVEPYAGGAGAGLALLRAGVVDKLVINDIDPAVYWFWDSAVHHSSQFVERLEAAPLTVDFWDEQRAIYRAADERDPMALGFAFFYLNRTNRSGVLNAGPIGGRAQQGAYTIGARFNRAELIKRINELGSVADRITIHDRDGRSVVQRYAEDPNVFLYIDPPYVEKGSSLYLNAFDHRDHKSLADVVCAATASNWIVTYDDADFIRHAYAGQYLTQYILPYSAHKSARATELLIASPTVAPMLPKPAL